MKNLSAFNMNSRPFKADPVQQHHKGGVQQHDQDHWLDPHCPGTNSSLLADTQDLKLFLTFPGSIRKFAQ